MAPLAPGEDPLAADAKPMTCETLDDVRADASVRTWDNPAPRTCEELSFNECQEYYVVDDTGAYRLCTEFSKDTPASTAHAHQTAGRMLRRCFAGEEVPCA